MVQRLRAIKHPKGRFETRTSKSSYVKDTLVQILKSTNVCVRIKLYL